LSFKKKGYFRKDIQYYFLRMFHLQLLEQKVLNN